MDICDIASQIEEMQREHALARLNKPPAGESAKWCEGAACGARIPEARRIAVPGCRFCIDCQQIEERKMAALR